MKARKVSGLLYGLALRPPQATWDGSNYTGPNLVSLDQQAALSVPGVVDIVVQGNFVGVVAAQLKTARHARSLLQAVWSDSIVAETTQKTAVPASTLSARYTWPVAPADQRATRAIARFDGNKLQIQVDTTQGKRLHAEIAYLCQLPTNAIQLLPLGESGDGFDAAADAALLACRLGQTVCVVNDPPPSETTVQIQIDASTSKPQDKQALLHNCTIYSNQYTGERPSMASLSSGFAGNYPASLALHAGYWPETTRYLVAPTQAPLHASLEGTPAAAQIFAFESFFDEICRLQGLDPVQTRLNELGDGPGAHVLASVAQQAGWLARPPARQPTARTQDPLTNGSQATKQAAQPAPLPAPNRSKTQAITKNAPKPGWQNGRGFAYTHIVDRTLEPPQQVWSAWVADISVNTRTGALKLSRLTVGYHAENLTDTAPHPSTGIEHKVRHTAARLLKNSQYDSWGNNADKPGDKHLPAIQETDIRLVPTHPGKNQALGWNEHAGLPAAAAIANAIYDATGVRFRQPPFSSQALLQHLGKRPTGIRRKTAWLAGLGALAAAVGGLVASALPWRPAIAPVTVDTRIYSEEAIERGKLVAIAGDCMVCHTSDSGAANAGGLALDTPFGTLYSTNITPDKETGIGSWSYPAFERAMREGIHQNGKHLYPAFPYTAFAKISDTDMQSLYAWLMTQEPVKARPPENKLRFPYSVRPLMAGWNALFHRNTPFTPDPSQSTLWNRGAYLVQGMGHCAACHSPRNALGAEKTGGLNFLGGGFAEGWEAPPLNELSKAPLPWTENDLYQYLRTGFSSLHGVAAGPMAPVVQGLAQLPEQDVRAMAHYLASLNPDTPPQRSLAIEAARLEDRSRNDETTLVLPGESLFDGACAVCHDARGGPPLFGARPSLALNTNLHSDSPDNLIQVLLKGIEQPAFPNLGTMPAFGNSLNDEQLLLLVRYLRARFAPDKQPWNKLEATLAAIRKQP